MRSAERVACAVCCAYAAFGVTMTLGMPYIVGDETEWKAWASWTGVTWLLLLGGSEYLASYYYSVERTCIHCGKKGHWWVVACAVEGCRKTYCYGLIASMGIDVEESPRVSVCLEHIRQRDGGAIDLEPTAQLTSLHLED